MAVNGKGLFQCLSIVGILGAKSAYDTHKANRASKQLPASVRTTHGLYVGQGGVYSMRPKYTPLCSDVEHNWNVELQEKYFRMINVEGHMPDGMPVYKLLTPCGYRSGTSDSWNASAFGGVYCGFENVHHFSDLLNVTDFEYAYEYTLYQRWLRGDPEPPWNLSFDCEKTVPGLEGSATYKWKFKRKITWSSRSDVISRYLTKCAVEHDGFEYKPMTDNTTELLAYFDTEKLEDWRRLMRYL
jgi:hypothetical protein